MLQIRVLHLQLAALLLPITLQGQLDPAAILNRARSRILDNVERLPRYTCIQTVHRSQFRMVPANRRDGCRPLLESAARRQQPVLFGTDRYKLDVIVSGGTEIFSWAGAQNFESEDVQEIVGDGMAGTGDFGPFLIGIFGGVLESYQYGGLGQDRGRPSAVFRYQIPLPLSRYQMKVGPLDSDRETLAYEGTFSIDAETAELTRLSIAVPHPPRRSHACRAETAIEYTKVQISGASFLLPKLTVLSMWDEEGSRYENRIEYSACREFQSESTFLPDLASSPKTSAPVIETAPSISPGVPVRIALQTAIDSRTAFAGDAVEGRLLEPLRAQDDNIIAAKGAKVRGRIVRVNQRLVPYPVFTLGIRFESVAANGRDIPLALAPVTRDRLGRALFIAPESRKGVRVFVFSKKHFIVDRGFVSEWKTTEMP